MTGRSDEGAAEFPPEAETSTGTPVDPDAGPPGRLRAGVRRLWQAGSGRSRDEPGEGHGEVGAGAEGSPAALPSPDSQVSRLLQQTAAWSWRLLLTGLVIYLAFRLAEVLRLVTLPFIAAMLLAALLQPLAAWLQRHNMSRMLSTWCVFMLAIVIIAAAAWLVITQISNEYPVLFAEVRHTVTQLQHSLAGPPFHLHAARLSQLSSDALNYISKHKSVVVGTVVTGGKYALEALAGSVLALFISFFLIKDGMHIWRWLISGMPPEARRRTFNAGEAAWRALVNYVRGTTLVAAIHALFIGLALWLLGVPLLAPFIVMIFLAAFIPLIGILVVGALAILVTLVTKGLVAAIILLAVFILENQLEDHLLQPQVIGRMIRLHPLAIILVLAVGGIIAGIAGAIIAVPVAAVITYAWPELRSGPPPRADSDPGEQPPA
jgi:predicted PurR-regulated permease PerM